MEAFALYLFKSVVWLTGFALVYLLFLRNERYFVLNRIYLLSGIVASILFPFFTWHYTIVIPFTPSIQVSDLQMTGVISEPEAFPTKTILLYAYMAGALYLLYRIIRQTITVMGVIRNAEILPYRSAKLIRTAKYPSSFSFFSFVFVNPSSPETETREIVNHEMEHVRQRHWVDLLLFELLCTLQWLNPMCWLYGRFIRQNHEFLADQYALQRTQNPAIYRAALINQLFGGEVISLANSFHYSINKKRFHMMKNTIHPPYRKLKLLVILPLIAGVFYAFATPEYKYTQANVNSIKQTEIINTQPTEKIINQPTEKIITGKVMDNKGNPLAGSAVIITGTNIGTITDNNGVFKLKITDSSPIVVSHVGYDSQKLNPDTEKEMAITLKPVNIGIDEVTVTALANTTETKPPTSSFGSTIKVQTNAPLKLSNADGSSAQPLIVIDGVIAENQNVKNIPAESIESISVLKDETATKIYGERGKNGVILITTKKVKSGSDKSSEDVTVINNEINNAKNKDGIYTVVEQMPEFPGGDLALRKFLAYTIKYPKSAVDKGIQGKVFVGFVVDKTGKVTDAKIVRGVDPSLDQEGLRVVMLMPLWKPGKQSGKEVDVQYTIPINFVLEPAQAATKEKIDDEPYTVVEQMPEYPGGIDALKAYLASNIKYPTEAHQKGIQGKVFVSFVVTKTGSVSNPKVVRGVDALLDQEAVRVVTSMPTWIPGKQNGENVVVSYTIPINFVLEQKAQPQAEPSAQAGKLIIVPNPTKSRATVTLEGSDSSNKLQVSIIDSNGQMLKRETKNGPSFTLSVSSLTPGTYRVVAIDGNKLYQGSLMVNR